MSRTPKTLKVEARRRSPGYGVARIHFVACHLNYIKRTSEHPNRDKNLFFKYLSAIEELSNANQPKPQQQQKTLDGPGTKNA